MALRCDAPLLPLAVYDDGPARWRLVCYPPVNSNEAKPTAEGMTAMMNIAVEAMIRRAPENWFWVHNRWKTPQSGFSAGRGRGAASGLPAGYDERRLQPFQLLVRSPNWLGDACMALPAVRALKTGRPDLRLTILAPAKLGDLWKMVPEVDAVMLKDAKEGTGVRGAKDSRGGAIRCGRAFHELRAQRARNLAGGCSADRGLSRLAAFVAAGPDCRRTRRRQAAAASCAALPAHRGVLRGEDG